MIEKMNHHYSMTNPATIYSEEALTSLELAGRTAAKMNETVEAFNSLEKATNNRLDEQDLEISDRMNTQDENISTAINKTIPNTVSSEFDERIENGTFDAQISDYAGGLETRVDNLLGSLSEGSTTSDAELLDVRVGWDNTTYENAGGAVREQFKQVNDKALMVEDSVSIEAEAGQTVHPFNFVQGVTYVLTANNVVNLTTRFTNAWNSPDLETVTLQTNVPTEFVCQHEAHYFRFYINEPTTVHITRKGTVLPRLDALETDFSEAQAHMEKHESDTIGKITIVSDKEQNVIVPYKMYAGHTYTIKATGAGVYFTTRETDVWNAPELQAQQLLTSALNTFECTVDSNYIRFFCPASGCTLDISRNDAVTPRLEKAEDTLDKLTDGVPEYYREHMKTKINTIIDNMSSVGRNGETFVFITDLHWGVNDQNSQYLVRNILDKANVRTVISGGDLIGEGEREPMMNLMHDVRNAFDFNHPFITAFGNHDSNWNPYKDQHDYPERKFDLGTCYTLFGKQMDGLVTWFGEDDLSFYFDNEGTKTRFIVLDTGEDLGSDGRTFTNFDRLAEVLMETGEGWHIVIVAHIISYGIIGTKIESILDCYNLRTTYDKYDFTTGQATVVMGIGGHMHNDGDFETDMGIPLIMTDCDGKGSESGLYEQGTVNEQCFDVVTIDYANKTIKCVRIGRGSDRTFTY